MRREINNPEIALTANSLSILGADVSSLQHALDLGAKYFDEDGVQGDPLQMLKDHGINYIRLRVWVDPANGYSNKSKLMQFAPLIKAKNMKLLIDFHYSDTWSDPEHQTKPESWASHAFGQLQEDVYEHTCDVCSGLISVGAFPDMVQIGNEVNPGMLLPDGSMSNPENLATLLKRGYCAVKSCSPLTQVMLHIANAGDSSGTLRWFENVKSHDVQWDVTGLSYYSYWHGTIPTMTNTVKEVGSRFGKPVVIVETAYPFTLLENDDEKNVVNSMSQLPSDYPATPIGQATNIKAVLDAARLGGAIGVFYWEPTWTAVKGNGWDPANPNSGNQWENQALFDYDGKALPAMNEFKP